MLNVLIIICLVAAVSSTYHYKDDNDPVMFDFFDPKTLLLQRKLNEFEPKLKKLIMSFADGYRPSKKLEDILKLYTYSAELVAETDCAVEVSKFDNKFQEAVAACASSSYSTTSTDLNFNDDIMKKGQNLLVADRLLREISTRFSTESERHDWPGNVDKPQIYASLDDILIQMVNLAQNMITTTNYILKDCIEMNSEQIMADVLEASLAIQTCHHPEIRRGDGKFM